MRVALKSQASQITFPLSNTSQQRTTQGNNNFQGQMPAPPPQDKPQPPVWLIIVGGALTTASLIVGGVMWMMRGSKTTETPAKPSAPQKTAQQNFAQVAQKTIDEKNASVASALKNVGVTQAGELEGIIKTLKVAKKLDSTMPSIDEAKLLNDFQSTFEKAKNLGIDEGIATLYSLTMAFDEAGIKHDFFMNPLNVIEVVNSILRGKHGYLSMAVDKEYIVHSFSPGEKLHEYQKDLNAFYTLLNGNAPPNKVEFEKLEDKLYKTIIGKLHGTDIATGELVSFDFSSASVPFPLILNTAQKGLSFVQFLMGDNNFSSFLKQEHKLAFVSNQKDFINSLFADLQRGDKLSKYFVTG